MEQPLYLNSYTAIIKQENKCFFEINGKLDIDGEGIELNTEKEKMLNQMIELKSFSKSEISNVFGEKTVAQFISNNILIKSPRDLKQINSRTDAFFQFEHINNSNECLAQKKIMILGCGGIGTHAAWNLAAMGIGGVVLVDFDVVELSNLNRQLFFDVNDVGKYKVDVLKEKISLIAPSTNICSENIKINSVNQLEELFKKYACNLIIKTADYPEEFPMWLDQVCSRLKINYISGTLSGTYFVVGPTYIAGDNCVGYSELFPQSADYKIISGTRPSLSCQVSKAAALIASEACRLLLNIKKLKYKNKVYFEDTILQTSMELIAKQKNIEPNEEEKRGRNKNLLFFSMVFLILNLLFDANYMFWAGGLFLMFGAVTIFTVPSKAAMAVTINAIQYYIIGFFILIINNNMLVASGEIITSVVTLLYIFIIYSIIILLSTFVGYISTYSKMKIIFAIQRKRKVERVS